MPPVRVKDIFPFPISSVVEYVIATVLTLEPGDGLLKLKFGGSRSKKTSLIGVTFPGFPALSNASMVTR